MDRNESVDVPIEILKQISIFLKRLTREEIEGLSSGQLRLACVSPRKKRQPSAFAAMETVDPEQLRSVLSSMDSRDSGYEYIDHLGLNKEKLRRLALALDLPAPHSDTIDKIKDRIIEATIGYRIRSEAIRGESPQIETKAPTTPEVSVASEKAADAPAGEAEGGGLRAS
jgi:hypothetical protein